MAKPIRYCVINDGTCSKNNRVYGHGLCSAHYQRWKKTGGFEYRQHSKLNPSETGLCSLLNDTCSEDGKIYGRGWCTSHYNRWYNHGEANIPLASQLPPKTCSVDGCDERLEGNGFCEAHYQRVQRHGDPRPDVPIRNRGIKNESCTIPDCPYTAEFAHPDRKNYDREICSGHLLRWKEHGSFLESEPMRTKPGTADKWVAELITRDDWPKNECITWPFGRSGQGYGAYSSSGESRAHRAICVLVYGPSPFNGAVVRHLCGKGHERCVNPAHLAWGTHQENSQDALEHESGVLRLSAEKVRWIRSGPTGESGKRLSHYAMSVILDTRECTIQNAASGRTWKYVTQENGPIWALHVT